MGKVIEVQELFPFLKRESEVQKNAIVIDRTDANGFDFDLLAWVLKARTKDKKRVNLLGLYSDGMGKFAASDGHRLHIAEIPGMTEKIPQGIWLHVHETKTQISIRESPEGTPDFPEFGAIADLSENHKSKGEIGYTDDSATVWAFWDMVGVKCNINYLLDILEGREVMTLYAVPGAAASPIFFCWESGDGRTQKAILMPFKEQ